MQPVSGDAIPTTMRDLNPPASPPTPSNGTTSLSVSDDDIIHGFKKLLCEMDHLNKTQILENSGGIYFFHTGQGSVCVYFFTIENFELLCVH